MCSPSSIPTSAAKPMPSPRRLEAGRRVLDHQVVATAGIRRQGHAVNRFPHLTEGGTACRMGCPGGGFPTQPHTGAKSAGTAGPPATARARDPGRRVAPRSADDGCSWVLGSRFHVGGAKAQLDVGLVAQQAAVRQLDADEIRDAAPAPTAPKLNWRTCSMVSRNLALLAKAAASAA